MIIWEANSDQSRAVDLWSTGHDTPKTDSRQDYNSTFTYNSTHVVFISDRLWNTGDPYDFVIKNVSEEFILTNIRTLGSI